MPVANLRRLEVTRERGMTQSSIRGNRLFDAVINLIVIIVLILPLILLISSGIIGLINIAVDLLKLKFLGALQPAGIVLVLLRAV